MSWVYDDGGRELAGYRGTAGDCVVRALAIATPLDYIEAYQLVRHWSAQESTRSSARRSSPRSGVRGPTVRQLMAGLGWQWHPTMGIGTGCRVHLAHGELPGGRLVVQLSRHVCAVVDSIVHDTYDPCRDGTRCVYGYYSAP